MRKKIEITTDGSCIGNPGPGGWACILRYGEHEKELTGSDPRTTNNRMELTAAIAALSALTEPCEVRLVSDSQYLTAGMAELVTRWKAAGWATAVGSPVANRDLWEELERLATPHHVKWTWVRGHAGDPYLERCGALALRAARNQMAVANR
jgi:ribonuclease HI